MIQGVITMFTNPQKNDLGVLTASVGGIQTT